MAYYPERMQIIMFVGYREKSRNCIAVHVGVHPRREKESYGASRRAMERKD